MHASVDSEAACSTLAAEAQLLHIASNFKRVVSCGAADRAASTCTLSNHAIFLPSVAPTNEQHYRARSSLRVKPNWRLFGDHGWFTVIQLRVSFSYSGNKWQGSKTWKH